MVHEGMLLQAVFEPHMAPVADWGLEVRLTMNIQLISPVKANRRTHPQL